MFADAPPSRNVPNLGIEGGWVPDLGRIPLCDNCDNGCHKRLGRPNRDIQFGRFKITLERAGPRVFARCREGGSIRA